MLVPSATSQPVEPSRGIVSYTAKPAATAETSAMVRLWGQMVSCWKGGLGSYREQPHPVPGQALSAHPRRLCARVSVVPPTAVT
jgi:hypothetical protein